MNKSFALAAFLACLSCGHAFGGEPRFVHIEFPKLLPEKWYVASITTDETGPYAWEHDDKNRGICIGLEGPTQVQNRGFHPEGVVIWLMPETYQGRTVEGAQLNGASYLGTRGAYKVFAQSWTGVVTWKTWRSDLVARLKIKEASPQAEAPR